LFTLNDAYGLAKTAHNSQQDKQGRDYFEFHLVPIARALAPLGEHAEMAGVLHDIIEDTCSHPKPYTPETLLDLGVPKDVVKAVVSVTTEPGEPYLSMIRRACRDPLGCSVKLEDNYHNIGSNPALAVTNTDKAERLLMEKYVPARDLLIAAATLHRLGLEQEIDSYLDKLAGQRS
jgi:(p)ppGpp synthase/HD superfamily hydrolase